MSDTNPNTSTFTSLNTDITESILSLLPIPSLIRFSSVSKQYHSIIPSLPPSPSSPWLFLFGLHNTSSLHNQSFAFDPHSSSWFRLPHASSFPSTHLLGSNRFLFTTAPKFSFSPILQPNFKFTSQIIFPRISPLLGVFTSNSGSAKVILVGGNEFLGRLVDINDRLVVQIYDTVLDTWEVCPPLPADFQSGDQPLDSAIFKRKFYVFGTNSCFIASFCLDTYTWSEVQTLRPPGLSFAFLNSCNGMLVLGGMCGVSFNLWRVEEGSMEFSEIAIMPQELLFGLVDEGEDDEGDGGNRFRSLKCVGDGNVIYVFNEDCHMGYPVCMCEIDGESGECRWRRVPQLPSPVNKFHKLVSFCSTVSISDVFHSEETQIGSING